MSRYKVREPIMIPQQGKVLIDFYADWCGPCKALAPVLDKVTPELESTGVSVLKINIDENSSVAQQMGIRGVPTLVLINNGQEINRKSGLMNETALRAFAGAA